jgi:hypothetical protein
MEQNQDFRGPNSGVFENQHNHIHPAIKPYHYTQRQAIAVYDFDWKYVYHMYIFVYNIIQFKIYYANMRIKLFHYRN